MANLTFGLNYVVRGASNLIASTSKVTRAVSEMERAVTRKTRSMEKNLSAANSGDINAKIRLMRWQAIGAGVSKVATGYRLLASAVGAVTNLALAGVTSWVATGFILKSVASKVVNLTAAFTRMGLTAVASTEKVISSISMLEGRLGEKMGKVASDAAMKAGNALGIAFEEVAGTLNMFLNNPELKTMITSNLEKGSTKIVGDLAMMLKQIQMTQPDIAARLGIMLPNILGGSVQSFKAGFEVTPEQAEGSIKQANGGRLPTGVSAKGFRGAKGLDPFNFVQAYLNATVPVDKVKRLGMMFSAQQSVLGSTTRRVLTRITGGETDSMGIVGMLGKALNDISTKMMAFLDSKFAVKLGDAVGKRMEKLSAVISKVVDWTFGDVGGLDSKESFTSWADAAGERLLGVVKQIGSLAAGAFTTISRFLEQSAFGELYSAAKSMLALMWDFFHYGLVVFRGVMQLVNKFTGGRSQEADIEVGNKTAGATRAKVSEEVKRYNAMPEGDAKAALRDQLMLTLGTVLFQDASDAKDAMEALKAYERGDTRHLPSRAVVLSGRFKQLVGGGGELPVVDEDNDPLKASTYGKAYEAMFGSTAFALAYGKALAGNTLGPLLNPNSKPVDWGYVQDPMRQAAANSAEWFKNNVTGGVGPTNPNLNPFSSSMPPPGFAEQQADATYKGTSKALKKNTPPSANPSSAPATTAQWS